MIGTSDSTHFNTGGPIFVCFVDPLSGLPGTTTQVGTFSLDVDIAPVSFIAYDSQGNEVGRTYFSKGGNGSIDFAGLRYDEGIASIAINVPRSDYLAIDNFIFEPVAPVIIPITIDIKPGSYPNAINKNGNGVIPVAILGSADFNVTQIDVSTLSFEGMAVRVKGNDKPQCSIEDVSGDFTTPEGAPDGYLDLVCQFVDDTSSWTVGDGEATLTGLLLDSTPFEGTDSIKVVQ